MAQTDRFRLEERLGEGSFGEVYRAHDLEHGSTTVALKVLRRATPEAIYRFKREFRTLADLSHPNLVRLYELIHRDGTWMLSMEYIPGVDFLSWVRGGTGVGRRPHSTLAEASTMRSLEDVAAVPAPSSPRHGAPDLDIGRLRDALRQLVRGVAALHAAGHVHRDLKPSNVRVTPEGRVVVLDFGLVADLSPLDSELSVAVVGSPLYMSPEQAGGEEASPASDWYGFGVILFEALTGRHPFEGAPLEVLAAKRSGRPPSPRALNASAPADLASLAERLLARTPRVRPRAHQIRLMMGERDEPQTVGSTRVDVPTFVGRRRELELLNEAYSAARDGRATTVHVHGVSGIGKSALVERFFLDLVSREPEAAVLVGRCYEQEQVPYKAFDGLVDTLSRFMCALREAEAGELLPGELLSLTRIFPVLKRVPAVARARRRHPPPADAQELRRQAFLALRELLTRLARQRPVVMYIDDFQWADLDSVRLWETLLSRPDPPPLLMLVTYRSDEVTSSPVLRRLVGGAAGGPDVEVAMGPLGADEAEYMVSVLLPDGPRRGRELVREAGGHPLFIGLLASAARDGRAAGTTTLEDVIRSQVAELAEPARRLLQTVAVAGHPLERAAAYDAAAFASQDEHVLAELRLGRFIRLRGGELDEAHEIEPYHDRIREVVVAGVARPQRRDLHERLANVLSGSPDVDPEVVAGHFLEAGDRERAAVHVLAAARRADQALAFDRAARLYRQTLDLTPPADGAQHRVIRERLGDALVNAGRGTEAAEAFLAAVGDETSADALRLRQRAASQLLFSGRLGEGRQVMRAVWRDVGLREPRRPALAFLAQRALLRLRGARAGSPTRAGLTEREQLRLDACMDAGAALGLTDSVAGAYFATRYARWALASGEPIRIAQALHLDLVTDSFARGAASHARVERLVTRARELVDRLADPRLTGDHYLARAVAALNVGRWRACRRLGARASAQYREHCTGSWWFESTGYMVEVMGTIMLGELGRLEPQLGARIAEAQERGDVYSAVSLKALAFMGRLADDDVEGARQWLDQVAAEWDHPGVHIQHRNALWGNVVIDRYDGHPARAAARITEALPALRRAFRMHVGIDRILFFGQRATALVAAAGQTETPSPQRERLIRAARRDLRRVQRVKMDEARAQVQLLSGSLAALSGRQERALTCWTDAQAAFEAIDMALHVAALKRARAQVLGGDEGRDLVASADQFMRAQSIRNPPRMAASIVPGLQ